MRRRLNRLDHVWRHAEELPRCPESPGRLEEFALLRRSAREGLSFARAVVLFELAGYARGIDGLKHKARRCGIRFRVRRGGRAECWCAPTATTLVSGAAGDTVRDLCARATAGASSQAYWTAAEPL
jgi:hypothetical protein